MRRITLLCSLAFSLLVCWQLRAEEDATEDRAARQERLKVAREHVGKMEMRLARGDDAVELVDAPLLAFGDSARSNENGTLWAFGAQGRPLAVLELYQYTEGTRYWVNVATLTSTTLVSMKTPIVTKWTPAKPQIKWEKLPDAPPPAAKELQRTRQLKELARRFTGHEFWDPDNSRFELRLLVQPVHRYSDKSAGIHDGAIFALAHGTNPEVLMMIEAQGKSPEESQWHYGLVRMGSAEMHITLDGKAVWKEGRTPGVAGESVDPYWLFASPSTAAAEEEP